MKIKFEISKEELAELAKMAYVAQFFFDSSGKFSTGYKYPHTVTFNAALRIFNKMLWQYIPESNLAELDEENEDVFTHTMQMEDDCYKVLNEYGNSEFLEKVCKQLTDRDYEEQYNGSANSSASITSDVYPILYDNNMEELQHNGFKRLRVVE